ncbi:Uncharacterised protein [uncultured archaeon]|nr:Uncharacterised protein [uncultured archaeon]
MSEYQCDKCHDTKHILVGDSWERCSCLIEYAASIIYARAGITFDHNTLNYSRANVKTLYPHSPWIPDDTNLMLEYILESFEKHKLISKTFCLTGSATSPKDFILQCILKKALDNGYTAFSTSLDELIARNFQPNQEGVSGDVTMPNEFNRAAVTSVSFGNELQFRVGESFLSELIRLHKVSWKKKMLLLSTTLTEAGIYKKYETNDFKSLFTPLNPESVKGFESRVILLNIP